MYRSRITAVKKQIWFMRLLVISLVLILTLALLAPTAFARTYVITDGDRVVTYTTFATDPAQVLGEAGMGLGEYDTYTTEAVEGAEAINIQRSQNITIEYHGKTTRTTTFGETAGELLQRLNLDVSGEDVVSHGMDEETYDGMTLRIDSVTTVSETFTTTVPHEVVYCSDASVPEGMEEVLTPGVDGELLCTADITYINGEESQRVLTSEKQTRAPVTEVIGIGTAKAVEGANADGAPVISDGYITLPTGEVLTYTDTAAIRATAYTHTDAGCDMITATGTTVHRGTVAVDPRYIPYGTRMFIMATSGSYVYGVSEAEDCGGAIKGDRVDLYLPTYEQCMEFGRRVCTVYYLG